MWSGSRSVTETYENASAYRYGRCEAASIGKTSKDVFMVFFYLREKELNKQTQKSRGGRKVNKKMGTANWTA